MNGEIIKLKYLCTSFSTPLTQDDLVENGQYKVYGASGIAGYNNQYNCSCEYLGIIKDGAGVGRVNQYSKESSLLGTMAYIVPNSNVNINWLKYCISAMSLGRNADGTTIPHIYFKDYGNNSVLFVDANKQKSIADFLDDKCAKIDSAIEKTKKTIEEYKTLKQSIITEAVTKGIRGDRPMKDSRIEWVKDFPEEWESINPKALFVQRKEKAIRGERQLTASQQYGVIYQDEFMELTGNKVVTVEKDFDILKHVETGDFVISMRSFQGGLEYSANTGSISSAYVMLIPNQKLVYPQFYKWLLKSSIYINALQSTTNMVRDGQAMRYANFIQIRLYKVPMEEQMEIADYLNKKCTSIDIVIAEKEKLIKELEAYKRSLIYEYVTGKKEVM